MTFCFPVSSLSSERVVLVPFQVDKHAQALSSAFAQYPSLFTYLPFGPFPTLSSFLDWHTSRFLNNPFSLLYLIHVHNSSLSPSPLLAGTIGFLDASPANASVEIGFVFVLPPYQRADLAKYAIALLLHQALDPPSEGGWGLRRVQWQAHAENVTSIKVAQRMGFTLEGVRKWDRVLPAGKLGKVTEEERLRLRRGEGAPGRDSAMLALCWDEWEMGARGAVDKQTEAAAAR